MSLVLLDIFCLLLIAFGLALLVRQPRNRGRGASITGHAHDDPQTYILRIAGVMVMTFGLALGLMATVYHFA